MTRSFCALALAGLWVLMSADGAMACAPYTFDDTEFRLERGVAWAFRGHVADEVIGETGQPRSIRIAVDRSLAGTPAGEELVVTQDQGCDGFWYREGDTVVVAVPSYPGFLTDVTSADRLDPPYRDLTNYLLAVWVIDDGRVVPGPGPHSWPTIDGVHPRTALDLEARLAAVPDTATSTVARAAHSDSRWLLAITAIVAVFGTLSGLLRRRAGSTADPANGGAIRSKPAS